MISAIIIALDGRSPEWDEVVLLLATASVIYSVVEFGNTYADRDEDRLYFPNNPMITGELDEATARKALILQNIVGGVLLVALAVVTRSYAVVLTMLAGWFIALEYSLPPFKLKQTILAPFFIALGDALLLLVAWLVVEPSLTAQDGFILAFCGFFLLHALGAGLALKFRKTFHALSTGLIRVEKGDSVYNLDVIDLKLKVKTATAFESIVTLGSFILIPVFWHLDIFDMPLSVGLLTLPLLLTAMGVYLRLKDPVNNSQKCAVFMGFAWAFIILIFFAVTLSSIINWGWVTLTCFGYIAGAILMIRTMQPFGSKALIHPWEEV